MADIRLLPLEIAGGPYNMAADEVLLQAALAGQASLRFYGWAEATLSLGYFQPAAARLSDPALVSLPFVRRPTGGQALVHHRELTYALALPPGLPWQGPEPWLLRMHRIIAAAFHNLHISLDQAATPHHDPHTILCFRQVTPGDLLCQGAKVVGSAQRKCKKALLQHGGILLAECSFTPLLPGIQDQTGIALEFTLAQNSIIQQFTADTGWNLAESSWNENEKKTILNLVKNKYATMEWNEKR